MPQQSSLPLGWKETTLGENLIEIAMGPFGSNLTVDMFTTSGVPIIKGGNLFTNFVSGNFTFVSEEKANSLRRSVAFPGDFITTHRGTLGQVSLVPDGKYPRYVTSQSQLRFKVNPNTIDRMFLLYFLKSKTGQQELLKNSSQVGVPAIATPTKSIKEINLNLPELPEQHDIAAVLSSLDGKIELLREQNKTLESLAQTIFKEWFVKFNFPGSTGKMIDSELGQIPEGWRVGRIKDLVDILSGYAFSSLDFSCSGLYKLVTIKNVQDKFFDSNTKDNLSKLPEKMPNYCKLQTGDILLSLTGNVGRICLVNGENFVLNQRVAKIRAKNEIDYSFSYLLFLQDSIFSILQSTASGTAQQNLSPVQTKEIKIVIADRKILDQFGTITNELIYKINDNNTQMQTLSTLHDTLLPKLMNGKIRVKG